MLFKMIGVAIKRSMDQGLYGRLRSRLAAPDIAHGYTKLVDFVLFAGAGQQFTKETAGTQATSMPEPFSSYKTPQTSANANFQYG